jgi:hypothetical protein
MGVNVFLAMLGHMAFNTLKLIPVLIHEFSVNTTGFEVLVKKRICALFAQNGLT